LKILSAGKVGNWMISTDYGGKEVVLEIEKFNAKVFIFFSIYRCDCSVSFSAENIPVLFVQVAALLPCG